MRGLVGQGHGYSLLVTRPHGDHAYDGGALAVRPILDDTEKGEVALVRLKALRPTRLARTFEQHARRFFEDLTA